MTSECQTMLFLKGDVLLMWRDRLDECMSCQIVLSAACDINTLSRYNYKTESSK